jgi:hypothetical protein
MSIVATCTHEAVPDGSNVVVSVVPVHASAEAHLTADVTQEPTTDILRSYWPDILVHLKICLFLAYS